MNLNQWKRAIADVIQAGLETSHLSLPSDADIKITRPDGSSVLVMATPKTGEHGPSEFFVINVKRLS